MKRIVLVLVLAALASGGYCVENQAFWGMFAETSVQKMPGMPEMPKDIKLPPGMDLSKMPGMAALMAGGPKRTLNVRLWSPGLAPDNAFAYITPPAGLKVGNRMDLELYRPKPSKGGGTDGGEAGGDGEFKMPDFTIKIYWGSSATVKPGQPKVIKFGGLTAEQKATMKAEAQKAQDGSSYFYKPDWTTGYWPTPKQQGQIAEDAALVGNYALTTSYTGSIAIDCPSNVNFLAPITFTSPDMKEQIPLDKAIAFKWNQIPNALGLHASIFGMEGKSTLILWSSSEVESDMAMGNWDYLQMAEVRDYVAKTIMMKGDDTDVTVPIGIFKDCDMASMTMIGYGPGAALAEGQPLPRIQTKTTLTMPLGGKMMKGMGGMRMPKMDAGDEDTGE